MAQLLNADVPQADPASASISLTIPIAWMDKKKDDLEEREMLDRWLPRMRGVDGLPKTMQKAFNAISHGKRTVTFHPPAALSICKHAASGKCLCCGCNRSTDLFGGVHLSRGLRVTLIPDRNPWSPPIEVEAPPMLPPRNPLFSLPSDTAHFASAEVKEELEEQLEEPSAPVTGASSSVMAARSHLSQCPTTDRSTPKAAPNCKWRRPLGAFNGGGAILHGTWGAPCHNGCAESIPCPAQDLSLSGFDFAVCIAAFRSNHQKAGTISEMWLQKKVAGHTIIVGMAALLLKSHTHVTGHLLWVCGHFLCGTGHSTSWAMTCSPVSVMQPKLFARAPSQSTRMGQCPLFSSHIGW